MTDGLVVVGEFLDYGEAALVAGALWGEGIRAVLPHDPRERVKGPPPLPPRTSTNTDDVVIELLVEEEDRARAETLIDAFASSPLSEAFGGDEIERYCAEKKSRARVSAVRDRLKMVWTLYALAGMFYLVAGAAFVLARP